MKKNKSAFTIVELIIVVAILIIMAGAALSGTNGIIRGLRFSNTFNKMVLMVQRARSLAVTGKNAQVPRYGILFDKDADPDKISFFRDDNNNHIFDTAEIIETYQFETTTDLELLLNDISNGTSCQQTIRIFFERDNSQTSFYCNASGPTGINIVSIGVNEIGGSRSKSFSIHRASGIPQIN